MSIQSYSKPISGRVTSKFGNRVHPVTGQSSFHNGVDIAAYIGTPVFAPATGIVIKVWDHPRGGKSMAIQSLEGVRFGFAHLDQQLKREGESVMRGDVIAMTGNSGASTGPHLHFTVKKNGQWIDPETMFTF
jgi:murein DD-endopeptidase MepM/ murein hydrolase activator NlpD